MPRSSNGVATSKTAADAMMVEIPEFRQAQVTFEIVGTTPLIAHQFGPMAKAALAAAQAQIKKVGKKEPRNPEAEFNDSRYILYLPRTNQKVDAFPAGAIKDAMVTAGKRYLGEKGVQLMGIFSIEEELLPIITEPGQPTMREDHVVLAGISRVSSLAYRPQYWPWSIQVPIKYNNAFISVRGLQDLLAHAGFSVGIGDWRTECSGTFGSFKVARIVPPEE